MAKKKARTKFAGTRVDNEMDRFLKAWKRRSGLKRSEIVAQALRRFRADMSVINPPPVAACSCSPDDRALHGCKCAEVSP